jgi:hypothetical protein
MNIKVVEDRIDIKELKEIAKEYYFPMIKGVVDIDKEIIAFGGEYHMDANMVLIDNGSSQSNVWGFNVYLDKDRNDWIEYTSLINIRPSLGNMQIELKDQIIRDKIKSIVNKKIYE